MCSLMFNKERQVGKHVSSSNGASSSETKLASPSHSFIGKFGKMVRKDQRLMF